MALIGVRELNILFRRREFLYSVFFLFFQAFLLGQNRFVSDSCGNAYKYRNLCTAANITLLDYETCDQFSYICDSQGIMHQYGCGEVCPKFQEDKEFCSSMSKKERYISASLLIFNILTGLYLYMSDEEAVKKALRKLEKAPENGEAKGNEERSESQEREKAIPQEDAFQGRASEDDDIREMESMEDQSGQESEAPLPLPFDAVLVECDESFCLWDPDDIQFVVTAFFVNIIAFMILATSSFGTPSYCSDAKFEHMEHRVGGIVGAIIMYILIVAIWSYVERCIKHLEANWNTRQHPHWSLKIIRVSRIIPYSMMITFFGETLSEPIIKLMSE